MSYKDAYKMAKKGLAKSVKEITFKDIVIVIAQELKVINTNKS